ncbi:hypothetical protein [Mucilaginibacter gracilis]|nr:hypothetical protein [Mucilaginibacter gracilis]
METMIKCHTCGTNITDARVIPAPWSVRRLQSKLNDLIAGVSPLPIADARSYLRVLYYLSSMLLKKTFANRSQQRFVQHVLNANGLDQSCIEHNELALIHKAPVQTRTHIICAVFWLLDRWPYRIEAICQEAKVTFYDLCSFVPQAPGWFTGPLQKRLEGILRQPAPVKERRFITGQYYNGTLLNTRDQPESGQPFNELDYDLDFDDMYYTNCNLKYNAYENLLSECCTYETDNLSDDHVISELSLKPQYRSTDLWNLTVYDYL